jgi:hypothetical protein
MDLLLLLALLLLQLEVVVLAEYSKMAHSIAATTAGSRGSS